MTNSSIEIAIVNYPSVLQSSLHGLNEMFLLANSLNEQAGNKLKFSPKIYDIKSIIKKPSLQEIAARDKAAVATEIANKDEPLNVVIFPPNMANQYNAAPNPHLTEWLINHHRAGAIICSVCAGAFMIANTGLLRNRSATTHWALEKEFRQKFPDVKLDISKILINDGDIITAAGIMSWVDLGLELVAQFMHPNVMRELGKHMIVDTGKREQRYYQRFSPQLGHGDATVLKAQHFLQQNFHENVTVKGLSELCILTSRTFLRRFVKATNQKPMQYLQRLRIQKACDQIEASNDTFENISRNVGYEDTSAFRKTFQKITGLTPKAFKNRFAAQLVE